MVNPQKTYKSILAEFFAVREEQITLFWKGRVGLYGLLQACGVGPGDEVVLPAFTCVVVPNAIIYLGAKPVYVDISPLSYNINIDRLKTVISEKTKVILAQNTFGLSSELTPIMALAKEKNIKVIEDCTHGFGGQYRHQKNGTICDAAFFSSQWNKPFSTVVGGFCLVNEPDLIEAINHFENNCLTPSWQDEILLSLLYATRSNLPNFLYWPALKTYRWLSQKNLILGSSSGEEITSVNMPDHFCKGLGNFQSRKGSEQVSTIVSQNEKRKQIARQYDNWMLNNGLSPVYVPEGIEHNYLKYPLLVKKRDLFLKLAERKNIQLGDWFTSPLHPIEGDLSPWSFDREAFPVAEYCASHMVNLPTDPSLSEVAIEKVIAFLQENKDLIIGQN